MTKRIARLALAGAALTAFALPAAPASAATVCLDPATVAPVCTSTPGRTCVVQEPTTGTELCV
ncbi:MAG TPA: hypothetical protein VGX28_02645 [Frankiaceae bacterium]|jgi:hypothetical protein|nr:hypothetical protein [Frankiaceae bacterium]